MAKRKRRRDEGLFSPWVTNGHHLVATSSISDWAIIGTTPLFTLDLRRFQLTATCICSALHRRPSLIGLQDVDDWFSSFLNVLPADDARIAALTEPFPSPAAHRLL